MPKPDASEMHINTLLTDLSVGFTQSDTKFVAGRVFPGVNVTKKSDKYATFSREDFLRDEMQVRLPGDESAGGGYSVSTDNYACDVWSFHKDVADQDRDNADTPYAPDRAAALFLAQKVLLKMEVSFVSNFFSTGVWTGSTTGTDLVGGTDFDYWNDVTSDPIGIIDAQSEKIESNTGQLPNKLVLNRKGWNRLKNHPDVIDRVKHTSDGPVTPQIVARLMGLDEILIAAGVRNAAQEGLSGSYSYIAGNHALLVYAAPQPDMYTPSGGYTFRWTGYSGSVDGQAISTIRVPLAKSDRHEVEMAFDQKVVSAVCGAFFSNVISA